MLRMRNEGVCSAENAGHICVCTDCTMRQWLKDAYQNSQIVIGKSRIWTIPNDYMHAYHLCT